MADVALTGVVTGSTSASSYPSISGVFSGGTVSISASASPYMSQSGLLQSGAASVTSSAESYMSISGMLTSSSASASILTAAALYMDVNIATFHTINQYWGEKPSQMVIVNQLGRIQSRSGVMDKGTSPSEMRVYGVRLERVASHPDYYV